MRTAGPALAVLLSIGGLAACGETKTVDAEDPARGLSSVKVDGEFGSAPKVTWDGRLKVTEIESKVAEEGSGPAIADKDVVLTHLWVGNGYSQKEAFNSFAQQAQSITVGKDTSKPLLKALKGQRVGSRVIVTATAEDAFGEAGNPQLGIGNKDSVLFVVDALDVVRTKAEGKATPMPAGMPTLIEKDGKVTGWDFTKAAAPTGKLQVVPLITGDGPEVRKESTLVTRYLGQVFKAKKPFDEAFSKPEPATFPLSGLVKGWQQGLVGIPAGSRVALVIPPELGYGKAGNKDAGIKGTDTLYFVIDILATS
ncbi:MAG: FKBP-type peptidyl-prolyl cis-trans isomerase [Nocardioides sp.]